MIVDLFSVFFATFQTIHVVEGHPSLSKLIPACEKVLRAETFFDTMEFLRKEFQRMDFFSCWRKVVSESQVYFLG